MRISIVIPTHNRKDLLRRCLAAVMSQDHPDYEVIVVDDGSTDGTGEMVRREFPLVRYIRQEPNRGPAAARNRGIEAATGDIVAFTDDDCEPPTGWLTALQQGFEQYPKAGAVGGVQEAPPEQLKKHVLARYEQFLTQSVYKVGLSPVVAKPAPGGTNNLAVPRDLLQSLGGFDETFPVAAGEDADLLDRIARYGHGTVTLPIKVTHNQAYTWCRFLRQQVQRGIGAYHFLRKRGMQRSLAREGLRLLLTPVHFVLLVIRWRRLDMAFVHAIAGLLQTWGRMKARF